ncbi:MAG: hypothetical protein LBE18_03970 [Planctomycetaceae bacterium]|jgi:hypothetical protein|nr:hypothetical protein [Planctomycetaceae bacterium]
MKKTNLTSNLPNTETNFNIELTSNVKTDVNLGKQGGGGLSVWKSLL